MNCTGDATVNRIVAGFTSDPYKFLELGEHARAKGFKNITCTMPYAVHGFDKAYGFKRSWIGYAALAALFTGWCLGFTFQCWTMEYDYLLNVGGRPPINWPAFIPVTFESGIMCVTLTTLTCLVLSNRLLPNPFPKVMRERCTDDLFSIVIPIANDEEKVQAETFLKEEKLTDIETFDRNILEACYTQCGSAS